MNKKCVMATKKLQEMSKDELLVEEKKANTAAKVFLGIVIVQFCVSIFLMIKQGFSTFTTLPFAFLPLILIGFNRVKEIQKEIASR
jgi:hypothetical protein